MLFRAGIRQTYSAASGEYIRPLGFSGEDFIYGVCKEEDMVEIAHLMALVAKDFEGNREAVRAAVDALCDRYPLFE